MAYRNAGCGRWFPTSGTFLKLARLQLSCQRVVNKGLRGALHVDFPGYLVAHSLPATIFPRADGQPVRRGCLRAGDSRGDRCRPRGLRYERRRPGLGSTACSSKSGARCRSTTTSISVEFSDDEQGARRNLDTISLRPRIAFLLSSLEGFETAEVARTLDCSIDEAASLIDGAGKEIANQIRTDVLIIEDEPFIALDLQTLVEELGHRVVNVARTHSEAIEAVNQGRPGLILADIQLADGSSGLEAVNQILDSFSVPVIFITAYPERFLTGTPPEPAFLITKPFGVDSLKAVISQALFFDRRSHRKDQSEERAVV